MGKVGEMSRYVVLEMESANEEGKNGEGIYVAENGENMGNLESHEEKIMGKLKGKRKHPQVQVNAG